MPGAAPTTKGAMKPWLMIAAVLLFIVDLALKYYAEQGAFPAASGFFTFGLFKNQGIAFGFPVADIIYWPASLFLLLLMVAGFLRAIRDNDRILMELHVFILLGSASNLWDRLMKGAVTDYLIFFGRSAWNISDGMIIGAIAVLLWRDFRAREKKVPEVTEVQH